jgi:caffeoyl-CoA O-methyltransferase
MFLYKISRSLISNSRIISFSKTAHFKFLQQHAFFHNTPQRYSNVPFLSLKSGPYCEAFTTPQPAHLQKVYDRTLKELSKNETEMLASWIQGSYLTFLSKAMNVKKVLEIGCFTGYSALCFAEGIKENGPNTKVVTCEYDQKYANIALQNVKEAGMDDIIEIKVGNGLDT